MPWATTRPGLGSHSLRAGDADPKVSLFHPYLYSCVKIFNQIGPALKPKTQRPRNLNAQKAPGRSRLSRRRFKLVPEHAQVMKKPTQASNQTPSPKPEAGDNPHLFATRKPEALSAANKHVKPYALGTRLIPKATAPRIVPLAHTSLHPQSRNPKQLQPQSTNPPGKGHLNIVISRHGQLGLESKHASYVDTPGPLTVSGLG